MSKKENINKTLKPDEKKIKKEGKKSVKNDSKKINIKIAPGNWERFDKYITDFNENPGRTSSKLKYTNVINEALSLYFEKKESSE